MEAPKTHYTVNRLSGQESKTRENDPTEDLGRELAAHYAETWTVLLEKRVGSRWEAFAKIDVFHPDEPVDDDTPEEQRRSELVDELVNLCEGEAKVDGPTRVRLTGRPERGPRPVWGPLVFTFGPQALAGELAIEAKEANTAALTTTVGVIDRLARHLDRAWARNQSMQDSAMGGVTKVCASVAQLVDASNKVAGPMVELEKIRVQFQEQSAQLQAEIEHERNSTEMFMRAAELIGQAVTAERRDQARDAREADTIDAEAKPAEPRANGTPYTRHSEAAELSGILVSLSDEQRSRLQGLLSDDEWTTMLATSEARDVATYDARFFAFYEALHNRGAENFAGLTSELGKVLGVSALTVLRLMKAFERRNIDKLRAAGLVD